MKMACRILSACVLVVVVCSEEMNAATSQAVPGKNGVFQQWSGRVAMRLAADVPHTGCITNAKDFALLWRVWQMAGSVPIVNFEKYLILVATARSSVLQVRAVEVDVKGDLKTVVVATPDITADYAFVITLAERKGVKTVRGQPIE